MGRERIEIVVNERGAREVSRNLKQVGQSGASASTGVDLLKRALLAIGGVVLIRNLLNLADTFTNIQNRIRIVTNSAAELSAVTADLLAISSQTRQSFEATAEVYVRTANAVKGLGISQKEALDFTQSLNQAVILSGASSAEATAGLIQLSQGLASGALRGDELRSVLEQLPAVADIIANSLGVTRGQLRKLGEDGKITTDIILKAFRDARVEIQDRFAKTIPTVSQSFQVLRNRVLVTVGEFLKAQGVLQALSKTILFVSENIDTFSRITAALAIVLGIQLGTLAIGKLIAGLKTLQIVIAANPIGAIAVGIAAATAALVVFSDKIKLSKDDIVTLQDVAKGAFQIMREDADTLVKQLSDGFGGLKGTLGGAFDEADLSLKSFLQAGASVIDSFIGLFTGLANAAVQAFSDVPAAIKNIFLKALRGAVGVVQDAVNKIIEILNRLPKVSIKPIDIENIVGDADFAGRNLGQSVGDAFVEGFNASTSAQDLLGDVLNRANEIARNRIAQEQAAAAQAEAARAGLGAAGESTTERALAEADALKKLNRELDVKKKLLIEIKGPQEEFAIAQQQLKVLLDEGQISIHEYNRALAGLKANALETSVTAADGFRRGFQRIKADILDVSRAAENVLVNAFNSAEDALVAFVQTGKFNFSSFVDGILADVTRLLARQALSGVLNAFSGSAGGGGGFLSSLLSGLGGAKAAGGPVQAGRTFLVGEKGPELFTPNTSGNVIPNEALRSGGSGQPVNVQVINVQDPNEIPQAMASQQGDKVIVNSITRNKQTIKSALGIA